MQISAQLKGIFTAQGWRIVEGTHSITVFEKAMEGGNIAKIHLAPDVSSYHLDAFYTQNGRNLLCSVKSTAPYYLDPDEIHTLFTRAMTNIDTLLERSITKVA